LSAAIAGSLVEIAEGADDWLFLDHYAGVDILGRQADLTAWEQSHLPKYVAQFSGRHARMAARGIPYIVVIAPEKASIYPEMLPPGVRVADPTAAELLTRACVAAGIEAVDLVPLLRSAKGPIDLYYKVDSHWSYYGAYIAYRAIIERVRRSLRVPEIPPDQVVFSDRQGFGDLGVHLVPERRGALQHTECRGRQFTAVVQAHDQREYAFATHICDQGHGKALVLRDSFITFLAPYLSHTFAETTYPAPPFAMLDDMIDDLKPDVVIHECAERALFDLPDGLADWQPRSWRQIYLEAHENPHATDLIRRFRQCLSERNLDVAVPLGQQLRDTAGGALDHNLAEALLLSGAYDSVLEICSVAEARRGPDPFVRYLQAHARHALGDIAGALTSLREALALRPGHARFLYELGCWLARGENKAEGAEILWVVVSVAPAHVEAWRELAQVHAQLGNAELASLARAEVDRLEGTGGSTRAIGTS